MPSEGRSPACFPRSILYPARKAVARFLCPGNNSIPATSLISLPVFRGRRMIKPLIDSSLSGTKKNGPGSIPTAGPGWASDGVAARGCVSGRGPRAQRSGRDSPGGAYRPKPTRSGGEAGGKREAPDPAAEGAVPVTSIRLDGYAFSPNRLASSLTLSGAVLNEGSPSQLTAPSPRAENLLSSSPA